MQMVVVHADGSVEWEKGINRELQVQLQAPDAQALMLDRLREVPAPIPLPCSGSQLTAPGQDPCKRGRPAILMAHQSSSTPYGQEDVVPYMFLLSTLACSVRHQKLQTSAGPQC